MVNYKDEQWTYIILKLSLLLVHSIWHQPDEAWSTLPAWNMNSFIKAASENRHDWTLRSWSYQPEEKEDDLNPTDDGEACEQSHSASNETQLALHLDLLVSLDVVEGGRVKVDLHQLQGWRG